MKSDRPFPLEKLAEALRAAEAVEVPVPVKLSKSDKFAAEVRKAEKEIEWS